MDGFDDDDRKHEINEAFDNYMAHIRLFILESIKKKLRGNDKVETWCLELKKGKYTKRELDDEIFTEEGMQIWARAKGDKAESSSDEDASKKSSAEDGETSSEDEAPAQKKKSGKKKISLAGSADEKEEAKVAKSKKTGASNESNEKRRISEALNTFRKQVRQDCKDVKNILHKNNLDFACDHMDDNIDYKLIKQEVSHSNSKFKHRAALAEIGLATNTERIRSKHLEKYKMALEKTDDKLTLDAPAAYINSLCNVNATFAHDECLRILDATFASTLEENEQIFKDQDMLRRFKFLEQYTHYIFDKQLKEDQKSIKTFECKTKQDIKSIKILDRYNQLYNAYLKILKGFTSTNEKHKKNAENFCTKYKDEVQNFIKLQGKKKKSSKADDSS